MPLPETGYVRLPDIIGDRKKGIPPLIPVSRTMWFEGMKEGRFPSGVLLGPRTRAWSVESIKSLIAEMAQ